LPNGPDYETGLLREVDFWQGFAVIRCERESAAAFMSIFPKRMTPLSSCISMGRGVRTELKVQVIVEVRHI
jgi:hypothetical protein